MVPIEEILEEIGVIGFDGSHEVEIFNARRIQNMPTAVSLFGSYDETVKRQYNLCFVLGPSGSGKTFFALDQLRNQLKKSPKRKSVTLYFKPSEFIGGKVINIFGWDAAAETIGGNDPTEVAAAGPRRTEFMAGQSGKSDDLYESVDYARIDAHKVLGRRVKVELAAKVRKLCEAWDWSEPLPMHVCFVFDEAGSSGLQGLFDDRDKVFAFVKWLENAGIAESLAVVVTGTSLVAQSFDSTCDAFSIG